MKYTTFSLLIVMLLLGCNNLQDTKAGNERQDPFWLKYAAMPMQRSVLVP
jgi:uncharacterized lipoprotein NlpE involved in copper resistance